MPPPHPGDRRFPHCPCHHSILASPTTKVRQGSAPHSVEGGLLQGQGKPFEVTGHPIHPSFVPIDSPGTVYISKVKNKGHLAIYRFSLNASPPAPWQLVSPGDGEVPSFQVSPGCREASCHYQGRGPSMPHWWPLREREAGSVRPELLQTDEDPFLPLARAVAGPAEW